MIFTSGWSSLYRSASSVITVFRLAAMNTWISVSSVSVFSAVSASIVLLPSAIPSAPPEHPAIVSSIIPASIPASILLFMIRLLSLKVCRFIPSSVFKYIRLFFKKQSLASKKTGISVFIPESKFPPGFNVIRIFYGIAPVRTPPLPAPAAHNAPSGHSRPD